MNETIGLNYRLEIEVLSPLHVGSGQKLLRGFDFEIHGNRTYRLREDVILDDYWPDDVQQQRLLLSKPLSSLLQPEDYRDRPHYFAYSLHGQPAMREIVACIKDPHLRPYLPGSSLKGAIRTALMRVALVQENRVLSRGDIGRSGQRSAEKQADDRLDREIFGPNPNSDLLRALRVGDSRPVPTTALALTRIRMVPGLDIDVEAIAPGTRLTAPLYLDTYLLEQTDRRLRWPRQNTALIRRFVAAGQEAARERLAHEYEYHAERRDGALAASFYARVIEEFVSDRWPKDEFLIQVGYAAGWRSKSVLGAAPNTDPLLADIVHEFGLDRGGKRRGGSGGYVQGQPFPKARHLAYVRDKPARPMGWLRVRAVPLEREQAPTIHRVVGAPAPVKEPEGPAPAPETIEVPPPVQEPIPSEEEKPHPQSEEEKSEVEGTKTPFLAPGLYTGTVVYYNFAEKQGMILLDEGGIEIKVQAEHLRQGVRYLAANVSVSLTLVYKGQNLVPQDVGPLES
jgi:CRISPR-associated protein Csm5